MADRPRRPGRLYYKPGAGFSYLTVWVATPGRRLEAMRGPFATVEACRADLRSIS